VVEDPRIVGVGRIALLP